MSAEESAYAALGLRPGAPRSDVDEAYRRLIKRYHPDMTGGDPRRAAEINRAYTLLRRQGAALSVRPPRRPPVRVRTPVPARGRRTGLALLGLVAVAAATALASDETDRGRGRAAFTIPLEWPESYIPAASSSISPVATFEEPLDAAVIDRAIADAVKFHDAGDGAATAEFSRACHDRLRRDPSLTWFDSCAAFDEAIVALGGDGLAQSGRFDASAVTARQLGAARSLSGDTLAADSRLRQIRSRVELTLVPKLDEAAAYKP
jgi:hypothetical protein